MSESPERIYDERLQSVPDIFGFSFSPGFSLGAIRERRHPTVSTVSQLPLIHTIPTFTKPLKRFRLALEHATPGFSLGRMRRYVAQERLSFTSSPEFSVEIL